MIRKMISMILSDQMHEHTNKRVPNVETTMREYNRVEHVDSVNVFRLILEQHRLILNFEEFQLVDFRTSTVCMSSKAIFGTYFSLNIYSIALELIW